MGDREPAREAWMHENAGADIPDDDIVIAWWKARQWQPPAGTPRLHPFVFVAATRYAIRRTLTSASELVAGQVEAHASLIASDAGAAGAIQQEIADFEREVTDTLASGARLPMGQSAIDLSEIATRWQGAGRRIAEARNG